MKLPKSYSLPWLPPVKNQEYMPRCVAFALAVVFEIHDHNYRASTYKPFSTSFLYGMEDAKIGMNTGVAAQLAVTYGNCYSENFDNMMNAEDLRAEVLGRREELTKLASGQKFFGGIKEFSGSAYGLQKIKEFIYKYREAVLMDIGTHAVACYGWEGDKLLCRNSYGYSTPKRIEADEFERGYGLVPTTEVIFPDIKNDFWAADAIKWAKELDIIQGDTDGNFYPDKPVTRAEIVTILRRLEEANA